MKPAEKALFGRLTRLQIVALTIFGEAEGEKFVGKLAVGFVIRNRAELWNRTVENVCLAANQFECYNNGNARLPLLLKIAADFEGSEEGQLSYCVAAAQGALSETVGSNVGKATFYKTVECESPWFDKARKAGTIVKMAEIGKHEFFEETKYRAV